MDCRGRRKKEKKRRKCEGSHWITAQRDFLQPISRTSFPSTNQSVMPLQSTTQCKFPSVLSEPIFILPQWESPLSLFRLSFHEERTSLGGSLLPLLKLSVASLQGLTWLRTLPQKLKNPQLLELLSMFQGRNQINLLSSFFFFWRIFGSRVSIVQLRQSNTEDIFFAIMGWTTPTITPLYSLEKQNLGNVLVRWTFTFLRFVEETGGGRGAEERPKTEKRNEKNQQGN